MPTLLQINVTANWGSTGRIAELINEQAIEKGWESYIAYGRYMNPSKSKLIKVGGLFDVYEHYVENKLFDNEGLASRRSTWRFKRMIEELRPDIIHLHNIHDHWLNYKILFDYLNKTSIPIVWTFHDFWAITGHCHHFVEIHCERWMVECKKCPMNKYFIDRSLKNFRKKKDLFNANDNLHIVAVSDWVGNLVQKSFLKNKDIRVIENGVDLSVFKPINKINNQFVDDDKFVILAVSSQWKGGNKGLNDYLQLSKILKNDEVIVLVGVHEELKKTLPPNIIGITRTNNQDELAAIYTRADVVTSFSSAETFGLTIVEGYACGTPAVVYDNTALPSLIVMGETGYVVPNKDYRAAYKAIQQIKKKGKEYYLDSCINLVKKKYNKEKSIENYIRLYNSLLKTNDCKNI